MGRLLFAASVGCASVVGCSSSTVPGVQVDVVLDGPSTPPMRADSRTFQTNLGYSVVLTRGYLSTKTIELVSCLSESSRMWRFITIPNAYAHTVGSLTLLGVPAVESLLVAPAARLTVGSLLPPAGQYCGAKWNLQGADADAIGLPEDADMVGKTVFASGSFSRVGESQQVFSMSSMKSLDADLAFPATELSSDKRRIATLHMTMVADDWFDDVDFESGQESQNVDALLQNIRRSLGAYMD